MAAVDVFVKTSHKVHKVKPKKKVHIIKPLGERTGQSVSHPFPQGGCCRSCR